MANYNFTSLNGSIIMQRTPIDNDTAPKTITFRSLSLVNALGRIRLYEAGKFYTSLQFGNFGTIGGVLPTDLQDAEKLLLSIIGSGTLTNLTLFYISGLADPCGNNVLSKSQAYHNGIGLLPEIGDSIFEDISGLILWSVDGGYKIAEADGLSTQGITITSGVSVAFSCL
jgi:hypothetical protein